MRKDPDRYGALIYHNRSSIRQSRDYNSNHYYDTASYGQQQQYPSQAYTDILLEEAEKLYTSLVKDIVGESISEYVSNTTTSSLLKLPVTDEQQCITKNSSGSC